MKKTSIFQISLILAGLFSAGLSRGANDDYLVIDISSGYGSENYPVTYYDTLPGNVTDSVYKSDKIVLKKISAGTFTMGSPEAEPGRPSENPDEDQHQVTLTEDFYIGVFEITAYQWNALTALGDSNLKPAVDNTVKIENIKDLQESFLGVLNSKTTLNGVSFDLPTEAQWEYACRAGTTGALNDGTMNITNDTPYVRLDALGRHRLNGGFVGGTVEPARDCTTANGTMAVGSYAPNMWGLYDMHGNVFEWCLDWHTDNIGTAAAEDPKGLETPLGGSPNSLRGGSWFAGAEYCRSASRGADGGRDIRHGSYGFRLVRNLP